MDRPSIIVIERRFHGPENSGNGGYVCGRVAQYIGRRARVRLRVPPPLDVPLELRRTASGVTLQYEKTLIAEGGPAPELAMDVPAPPTLATARTAALGFSGFRSHRFPSCFVCGPERAPGDGLRLFAGQVPGQSIVACPWIPEAWLASDQHTVSPEFMWAALDCPGGFAFPHPSQGTILLGELTASIRAPARINEQHVIIGWEIGVDGRKHLTGTAIFSSPGECLGVAQGLWFEVPEVNA